jgi:protein-S-isoprenylcysteine O-methyltransferase Ste14
VTDEDVPASGVANLGWVRPPLVYFIAIVVGLIGHAALPQHLVPRTFGAIAGLLLVLSAMGLFLSAVRTFKAAGTPVPGNQPTTRIVHAGPYRFTRNPIYLAFTLLQLGVALLINSVALLITLIPAFGLMTFVVIPREEAYLTARFGSEYARYKATVRRWL